MAGDRFGHGRDLFLSVRYAGADVPGQQLAAAAFAQALVRPAGMSRFGARTPDRSLRADMDVLNRVQGLLLPRAQAHH
jgi:hypothetical protein